METVNWREVVRSLVSDGITVSSRWIVVGTWEDSCQPSDIYPDKNGFLISRRDGKSLTVELLRPDSSRVQVYFEEKSSEEVYFFRNSDGDLLMNEYLEDAQGNDLGYNLTQRKEVTKPSEPVKVLVPVSVDPFFNHDSGYEETWEVVKLGWISRYRCKSGPGMFLTVNYTEDQDPVYFASDVVTGQVTNYISKGTLNAEDFYFYRNDMYCSRDIWKTMRGSRPLRYPSRASFSGMHSCLIEPTEGLIFFYNLEQKEYTILDVWPRNAYSMQEYLTEPLPTTNSFSYASVTTVGGVLYVLIQNGHTYTMMTHR